MAPRRARDRRPAATPAVASAPLVRDFGRAPQPARIAVRWDVRPAYDFLFALSDEAGSTEDLPAEDRRWLAKAKEALRAQVGDAVEFYGHEFCIPFAGLIVDRPDVVDAAAFIRLMHVMPDRDIVVALMADHQPDPQSRELTQRALGGDTAAIEAVMSETMGSAPHEKSARYRQLFTDPATILGAARDVLVRWLPFYAEVESRVGTMLQRDYEQRAGDRASLDSPTLIERTTGGIRWLSEPGIARVILAPSYFARPYNFVLGGEDWRMYAYPIADGALDDTDPLAPPHAIVRLHRALGDETRLRILRLLRDQDHYLTEIAERLELSKPTIKHHLVLLRSAGLVTIIEEGGMSYYSLRRERLDDASGDLKRFLVG